ncbi:MAG TPA: hypothetical protein PLV87_00880, partial [Opitutaceae bacterium]|nr:hypothetical protein [Opitutaceae bacterium]
MNVSREATKARRKEAEVCPLLDCFSDRSSRKMESDDGADSRRLVPGGSQRNYRLYKTTRSGYAPTRFEYDALGDVKRTGLDVDDNGLVTASNDRIEENETLLNGLPVRTLDVNGLLNTTEYDGLMRVAEVIDSRGNSTRTAYYSGSTLKQSVPDAANHAVATFGYDTSGGVVWQADALGHATRPSYTLRGKLHRTWGGEADPVEYGFDATYGDRVSQST